MEIILQEDYPSLGFVGDIVKVKPGFARNYLFPKKIAMPASQGSKNALEHRMKALEIKKSEKKKEAEKFKSEIEGLTVEIEHMATESDRLFGSVTSTEIHEKLVAMKYNIDRKLIKMEAPIKTVGEHQVEVKLHQEVSAPIRVVVKKAANSPVKEEVKKAPKAEKKAEATESEEQVENAE
ncbi:MAG: 50S ribosomal protein L9 [Deltaproteobacteria bacterium]|nr:50S ribosomal protein L9 [Deltaproteobacteria bacterium]